MKFILNENKFFNYNYNETDNKYEWILGYRLSIQLWMYVTTNQQSPFKAKFGDDVKKFKTYEDAEQYIAHYNSLWATSANLYGDDEDDPGERFAYENDGGFQPIEVLKDSAFIDLTKCNSEQEIVDLIKRTYSKEYDILTQTYSFRLQATINGSSVKLHRACFYNDTDFNDEIEITPPCKMNPYTGMVLTYPWWEVWTDTDKFTFTTFNDVQKWLDQFLKE